MKIPDWSTAPTWATHLAMDADGAWRWFEGPPQYGFGYWSPSRLGGRTEMVSGMAGTAAGSLQERPGVAS